MTGFLDAPVIESGGGYQISRSLRLRATASPSVRRTFPSEGNQRTWGLAFWCKRGALGVGQDVLRIGNAGGSLLYFGSDDTLHLTLSTGSAETRSTSAVFRDPSAWLSILVTLDTTQAVAVDRVKIYVNGQQLTSFSTSNDPVLNAQFAINSAGEHVFFQSYDTIGYFDGYCAEMHFIDGQAPTAAAFGEFSAAGNWQPKPYTGSYGTNGFRLKFDDPTSLTTLCADSSGNGNNWTANNISLTAGATYDSMLDVPLGAGGGERGNYCTFNPLFPVSASNFTAGNTTVAVGSPSGQKPIRFTQPFSSSSPGYLEVLSNNSSDSSTGIGFGFNVNGALYWFYASSSGTLYSNGTTLASGYPVITAGSTLQMAYDPISGKAWLGRNNSWYNNSGGTTGNPATGANPTFTLPVGTVDPFLMVDTTTTISFSMCAGQRPFTYTPPVGFKALHTGNLPEPAITNPSEHFKAVLWSGNATVRSISDVGFEPGLVWGKARNSGTANLRLFDTVRGPTKELYSSTTLAEATDANGLTSFNTDGFGLGVGASFNNPGDNYVAWCFKAGGASVANNNGSISSQVSANLSAGFSIVTYTGIAGSGTVGHGLDVAPKMIITKSRNNAGGDTGHWCVQHVGLASSSHVVFLNLTTGQSSVAGSVAAPTATTFGIQYQSGLSTAGSAHIAYCFAEIPGYSTFGSYTGNGSGDGPFVHCGFRPRFLLIKRTDASTSWNTYDSARDPSNAATRFLQPNASDAESSSLTIDFMANGFKIRNSDATHNANGGTYIFMALAEALFKYALAR